MCKTHTYPPSPRPRLYVAFRGNKGDEETEDRRLGRDRKQLYRHCKRKATQSKLPRPQRDEPRLSASLLFLSQRVKPWGLGYFSRPHPERPKTFASC